MDWKSKRTRTILEAALLEDKAAGDLTTAMTIDPKLRGVGTIVARQPCVLAGLGAIPVLLELFAAQRARAGAPLAGRFEVISHPEIFDGVRVKRGQTIAVIRCNAAALLSTERVLLNLLQRLSGIATTTSEYVRAATPPRAAKAKIPPKSQPKPIRIPAVRILDTRKTTPGLRALEKYAVICGGGVNHRQDLADGILIRSSHAALGGGLKKAIANALKFSRGRQVVQVQVRTEADLEHAIAAHAGAILLDRMTPAATRKCVRTLRERLPNATIGISGDMPLKRVSDYAKTGADFIAVTKLTQLAPAADLAMRITADAN